MEALGMVELNSIAQGIAAADAMLKAANVHIIKSQPVCPGKYVIIISGGIADVKTAVQVGNNAGGINAIDSMIITSVHEDVLPAITGCVELSGVEALGIIETFSLSQALVSADQAAKSGNISLMDIRLATGLGGKSFVLLTGSASAVSASISAAVQARGEDSMIVNTAVIPAPHKELAAMLQ
ncbi:Major carboxysome shell protein 1C [Pelotomaculum sp. FP]|uniref:BMC domain-containing protein n=1 Tax=Pelotomaculum sp. FP TaxID=261474 RepID=UPI0010649E52|nr:BMC domain-containing protein [Pelotomaculum sp. FP]TEB13879.1 Major carboxysome shell protein 1C [Pelotomaculum sp. FP]